MANPLPPVTAGIGFGLALVDGGYVVSEFAAIVAATAAVAIATRFWKMSKGYDKLLVSSQELTASVADIHARLDKLEVPQSDSHRSGA